MAPKRTRPPFFGDPDERSFDLLDAGLRLEHVALDRLAWATSSRFLLDGHLTPKRLRALPGWTRRRERELRAVDIGWPSAPDGGIDLPGFLKVNKSRDEIEELRERGAKGGAATAAKAERAPDGTFTVSATGDVCPIHGVPWHPSKFPGGKRYCDQVAKEGQPGYGEGKGFCTLNPTPNRPPNRPPDRPMGNGPSHAQESKQVLGPSLGTTTATATATLPYVRTPDGASASGDAPAPPASSDATDERGSSPSSQNEKKIKPDPVCPLCGAEVLRGPTALTPVVRTATGFALAHEQSCFMTLPEDERNRIWAGWV